MSKMDSQKRAPALPDQAALRATFADDRKEKERGAGTQGSRGEGFGVRAALRRLFQP